MILERGPSLIEAAGWIEQFRDQIVVVKLGGELLDRPSVLERLVPQLVVMAQCGLRPIVVHGGGLQIDAACRARGVAVHKVGGRRITTPDALAVLVEVIGELNELILSKLAARGVPAKGMAHGVQQAVHCTRRPPTAFPDGSVVDWGEVGDVQDVDATLLVGEPNRRWVVPVLGSLGTLEDGSTVNVNADTVASRAAISTGAAKLIFLTYVRGVMLDMNDAGPVSTMSVQQARDLIQSEVAKGGMKAKLEECLAALDGGVPKVHIMSGTEPFTLLRETFTDEGCGTLIAPDGSS